MSESQQIWRKCGLAASLKQLADHVDQGKLTENILMEKLEAVKPR